MSTGGILRRFRIDANTPVHAGVLTDGGRNGNLLNRGTNT